MSDVAPVFDWLVDGAPGATGSADLFGRVSEALLAAGVPLDRSAGFIRTLHPNILGQSFVWTPSQKVVGRDAHYALLKDPEYEASPVGVTCSSRKPVRRRLIDPSCPRDFSILAKLAGEGITDYLAAPLHFVRGETHAITFATKDPHGFSEEHVRSLLGISGPLARVAEIFALSHVAVTLLDTYVGRSAGARIMAGKIQRGDTDSIRAVIWFSDLRGFTALASSLEPPALIRALNDVFECQVPAIERHGGEVLKFMGDGLLAIFPTDGGADKASDAALSATSEAFTALHALNEVRAGHGEAPLRFGLALHVGDVTYGNIGSSRRLDFTCIGPAVNVASRLEGLTSKLDRPLVVSSEFAACASKRMAPVGSFALKGVTAKQEVLAPPEGDPLSKW